MTALAEETSELGREVARRRTFAIISHPDAGKTTLTEKLLLYGGAIDVESRRAVGTTFRVTLPTLVAATARA